MPWFSWFRRQPQPFTATNAPIRQKFLTIRGRRVVADMPYLLPKDDEEINRLDFQHYMLRYALNGLYAPRLDPRNVHTILDVATGTGRWAMDMAALFPNATVIGFDKVSPPADDSGAHTFNPGSRPGNYVFIQRDYFNGIPAEDNYFDFVHLRLVYAATPADKWPALLRELVRVTKPGGYIELVEGYILIDPGQATNTIQQGIVELSQQRGINLTIAPALGTMLTRAGAVDVKQRQEYLPLGKQFGRIGVLTEKDILSVFKGIGAQVVEVGILEADIFNRLYAEMPHEIAETQTLWPVYQFVGRKPSLPR